MKFYYSKKNTEVPALYIKEKDGTEALAILDCNMEQAEELAKAELARLPFAKLQKIEKAQTVRLDLFDGYYSNDGGEWIHDDPKERKGFYNDLLPEVVKMLNPNNSVKCYKLSYILSDRKIVEYAYDGELPSTYFFQKVDYPLKGFICVKDAESVDGWTLLSDDIQFFIDRIEDNNNDDISDVDVRNALKELDSTSSMFTEITLKTKNGRDFVIEKCDLPEIDINATIQDNYWSVEGLKNIFIHGRNLFAMYADGEI